MPVSADTYLRKASLIVEEFRRVDPEMPAQMIAAFLAVAQQPGIIAREVADAIGMSVASLSRLTLRLSTETNRDGTHNYGLIEMRMDPQDRRRKELHLTRKGSLLVSRLKAIDEGKYLGD